MSEWQERVASHPAVVALNGFPSRFDSLEVEEPTLRAKVSRCRHVADFASASVSHADPALVSQGMLDRLHGPVNAISSQLDQFPADPSVLDVTLNSSDELLDVLASWPAPPQEVLLEEARTRAEAYRTDAAKMLDGLTGDVATVREGVESVRATAAEADTSKSAALEQFEVRLAELDTRLAEQTTRLDTAISDFQTRSSVQIPGAVLIAPLPRCGTINSRGGAPWRMPRQVRRWRDQVLQS